MHYGLGLACVGSGELAQGSKIVESDLALKYGISRGPLREAIHRLEQMKLIVRIPHAGSRVIDSISGRTYRAHVHGNEVVLAAGAGEQITHTSDELIDQERYRVYVF